MKRRAWIVWSCVALGCGPEQVDVGDGETGETGADDTPAPAHWLIYEVTLPPEVEWRAVDVSQIDRGVIGQPVVVLDTDDEHYHWAEGPTPWGGYAFGQMASELEGFYRVSPDCSYGVVLHRENATTDRWYQFPLKPRAAAVGGGRSARSGRAVR